MSTTAQNPPASRSASLSGLLGDKLFTKEGEKGTTDVLKEQKLIGLYFSAHWCPPCRVFTPQLIEFYDGCQAANKGAFEIVFVSSDHNAKEFQEYYKDMPWMALPYAQRTRKDQLTDMCHVQGIPTLAILDAATGQVKSYEGRKDVQEFMSAKGNPAKLLSKWETAPVATVAEAKKQLMTWQVWAYFAMAVYFAYSGQMGMAALFIGMAIFKSFLAK